MELYNNTYNNQDFYDRAKSMGKASYQRESGFVENADQAFRQVMREGLSVSKLALTDVKQARNRDIMGMYSRGELARDEIEAFTTYDEDGFRITDWSGLAKATNKKYGTEILTDEEIELNMYEELAEKRAEAAEIRRTASLGGVVGNFLGSIGAYALDPLLAPTYFVGVGPAARSAGWLTKFIRAGAVVGGAEVAAETIRQPMVYAWKKEIGAEYSVGDAVTEIAAAGTGAFIFGGAFGAMFGRDTKAITVTDTIDGLKHLKRQSIKTAKQTGRLDDPEFVGHMSTIDQTLMELEEGAKAGQEYTENFLLELEDTIAYQEANLYAKADEPTYTPEMKEATKRVVDNPDEKTLTTEILDEDGFPTTLAAAQKEVDDLEAVINCRG